MRDASPPVVRHRPAASGGALSYKPSACAYGFALPNRASKHVTCILRAYMEVGLHSRESIHTSVCARVHDARREAGGSDRGPHVRHRVPRLPRGPQPGRAGPVRGLTRPRLEESRARTCALGSPKPHVLARSLSGDLSCRHAQPAIYRRSAGKWLDFDSQVALYLTAINCYGIGGQLTLVPPTLIGGTSRGLPLSQVEGIMPAALLAPAIVSAQTRGR